MKRCAFISDAALIPSKSFCALFLHVLRCPPRLVRLMQMRYHLSSLMYTAFARRHAQSMLKVSAYSLGAAFGLLSARALSSMLRRVLLIGGGSTPTHIQIIIDTQISVLSRSRLARPVVDPLIYVCGSLSISLSGVVAL